MNTWASEAIPLDKMRLRIILNKVAFVEEHLEAMQRDSHGIEYNSWKDEVDNLWKQIFMYIHKIEEQNQNIALEVIKESWVSYITHYGAIMLPNSGEK
jgi:plasmid replication initiation protein|tara:strand:+ start:174 stop:467 length:294 start_codon:yes stop_codon:yes gene_type:complete